MSGWDASSRPNRDPQDGPGENTQSFGVPDSWNQPQEPAGEGGFPSSGSPGTPPDIFLQDYDAPDFGAKEFDARRGDFVRDDFGRHATGRHSGGSRGTGPQGYDPSGNGSRGTGPQGYEPLGNGSRGTGPQGYDPSGNGFRGTGPQSYESLGNGSRGTGPQGYDPSGNGFRGTGPQSTGRHGAGLRGSGPRGNGHQEWDRAQQDYPGRPDFPAEQDYRGEPGYSGRPGFPGQGDVPGQDYPPSTPTRENHRGTARPDRFERPDHRPDPLGRGSAEPEAFRASEQAARMDPALRDFFAPQPARPGPGVGQGGRSAGQNRDPWGAQDARPGQDTRRDQGGQGRGPRQPGGGSFEDVRPGGWDSPAPRPGSRSARRLEEEASSGRSGRTALVVVATVIVIGIAVGAYLLLHRGHSSPPSTGATTRPTSSPTVTKSAAPPPQKTVAYTLTTPATAGGYPKLTTTPSAVQTAAGAVAQAIESAAKQDGGTVTGQVTAGYQLSGGQVLAFTGFKGTFSPAKVMASLATLGTDSHPGTAGPHGGMLACATAPGSPKGTVCVWVTTTTLGVTEFFGSTGPEVVTDQAKAASDTLRFRNSVEVAKS